MAAMIVITCPECKKQLKGPAELQGKRVRCKACGQVFAVRPSRQEELPRGQTKAAPAPGAKAKTATSAPAPSQEDKEKNPYQLTDIVLTNRCPQCAAELESPDAIVCLNCGYNSLTRQRLTTVRTYAHTPLDWAIWLAPGIACALATLGLIGLICFLLLPAGLQQVAGGAWWGHFSIQIYGSALAAGIAWLAAKYAFRRLVRNPRPPEKFKRGIDE
jgi:DNA-directed RNA polymerase subunit RPC12/RpoP